MIHGFLNSVLGVIVTIGVSSVFVVGILAIISQRVQRRKRQKIIKGK